jgi:hypothetical protein
MSRASHLSMPSQGKLGGSERSLALGEVEASDGLALVHARLAGGGATFESTFHPALACTPLQRAHLSHH